MGAARKRKLVPVTITALRQRINRRLKGEGRTLVAVRGAAALAKYGSYYVLDQRDAVVEDHVDPEALGRKLGVLSDLEECE